MSTYKLKTKSNDADVLKFIDSIKDQQKQKDSLKLLDIFSEVTKEKPVMWGKSIIGFGTYHYKYASGQEGDWMRTGFSPRVQNLTLYIMSGFEKVAESKYNPTPLLDKLGKYKTSKSCLYINKLEDIDEKIIRKLIEKSFQNMKS